MTRGTPRTPRFILLIPSAVVDSMFVYLRARFRFALIGGNLTALFYMTFPRRRRQICFGSLWAPAFLLQWIQGLEKFMFHEPGVFI